MAIREWQTRTIEIRSAYSMRPARVLPVDADTDGTLLAAAVAEHKANANVLEAVQPAEFRDQTFGGSSYSWADCSSLRWIILASSHGGDHHASRQAAAVHVRDVPEKVLNALKRRAQRLSRRPHHSFARRTTSWSTPSRTSKVTVSYSPRQPLTE